MRCAPKPPLQLWHDLAALREGGQQGFKPPFGCPTQIAWSEFGHACPLGTERGNFGVDRSQTGYYYAGANAMVLQETINRAQEEAEEIRRLLVEGDPERDPEGLRIDREATAALRG